MTTLTKRQGPNWLSRWSRRMASQTMYCTGLALTVLLLASVAVLVPEAGAQSTPPNVKAPFGCGVTMTASTYYTGAHGLNGEAIDFNMGFAGSVDIDKGKPVFAPANGSVVQRFNSHGQLNVKMGTSGFTYVVAHMTGVTKSVGQTVRTGDLLGYIGSVGAGVGQDHLHFHVQRNGLSTDYEKYVVPLIEGKEVTAGQKVTSTNGCSAPEVRRSLSDHTPFLGGNANYWKQFSYRAHGGKAWFTYGAYQAAQDNYAIWDMGSGDGGRYRVECYVPGSNSTANTRYELWANHSRVGTKWVNQANHWGWVAIGDVRTSGKIEVVIRDNQASTGKKVGVDVCRARPT